MTYKNEILKLKIRPEDDRRRKLSDDDRQEIKRLHEGGTVSIHGLAKQFNVSRRLIQFILFPERKKKIDNKKYYDREKHNEYIRRFRKHRQELFKQGRLVDENPGIDEAVKDLKENLEKLRKF